MGAPSPWAAVETRADRAAVANAFEKSPKQIEAQRLMNANFHTMLYGGARSTKTFTIVRSIVYRALKVKSRHLIVRLRYSLVIRSIALETFPEVMEDCFPDVRYRLNKQHWFVELYPKSGGISEIWFGGTDDPARMENVLGKEYSTVFLNEISQIHWEIVPTIWTRCAQNSGLNLKMLYDCNPPFRRHWAYTMFFLAQSPRGEKLLQRKDIDDPDSEMIPISPASMLINPRDNPGLTNEYMALLDGLPKRARDRYRDGLFLSDVEGALWTDEMIMWAVQKEHGEIEEIIISLDPATTHTETSDEWGILVLARDEFGNGGVLEDLSGQMSTKTAAQTAVNAYFRHKANEIVVETNQGGDMCVDILHNVNPNVVVEKVHAAKGKHARAQPIAMKYDQKRVWHADNFPELVDELTTYVPGTSAKSPNRLDSLTTGLQRLIVDEAEDVYFIGGGDPEEWRAAQ